MESQIKSKLGKIKLYLKLDKNVMEINYFFLIQEMEYWEGIKRTKITVIFCIWNLDDIFQIFRPL